MENVGRKLKFQKQATTKEVLQDNNGPRGYLELLRALRNFDKHFAKKTMTRVLENIVRENISGRKIRKRQPSRLPKRLCNRGRALGQDNLEDDQIGQDNKVQEESRDTEDNVKRTPQVDRSEDLDNDGVDREETLEIATEKKEDSGRQYEEHNPNGEENSSIIQSVITSSRRSRRLEEKRGGMT